MKMENKDFVVREISLFPPFEDKANSTHSYFLVEKEGLTTFKLIEILKDYFGLDFIDISVEGLKDEDGITEQLVSVRKILGVTDQQNFNIFFQEKNKKIRMLSIIGYGNEPLQPGNLYGNTFVITVRNLTQKQSKRIRLWRQDNKYFSFINYYDSQRFGTPGNIHNTHLIGKNIIRGKWK